MRNTRQAGIGVLAALLSFTIILGSIYISLAEGKSRAAISASPTAALQFSLPASPTQLSPQGIDLPGETALTASPSPTLSQTPTLPPAPPSCPPPAGWQAYTVLPGDTLDSLSQTFQTTSDALASGNCLVTKNLIPGGILYVPPLPPTLTLTQPPTLTPIPCGPPRSWVLYTVRPGDTLYHLSILLGVSVNQLKIANCSFSDIIRAGQQIYVPYLPVTSTPSSSQTATSTPTPQSGETEEPTATQTETTSPTDTVEPYPYDTPIPPSPAATEASPITPYP